MVPVEVAIENPGEGAWLRSPCSFTGAARGHGLLTVRVEGQAAAVEAGRWRATLALPDGERTVTVEVVDGTGRSATATRMVRVDTRPPRLEIGALPPKPRAGKIVVQGKVEDAGVAAVTVNAAPARAGADGSFQAEVTLVAGKQVLRLEATDLAGNQAEPVEKVLLVTPPDTGAPPMTGLKHLGRNVEGYEEYLHEASGLVLVLLPAGSFLMGSPREELEAVAHRMDASIADVKTREFLKSGLRSEGPRREVQTASFLIAKHEVKQAVWARVMKTNPSRFKGDSLPVENVTWNDCQEFLKRTGLRFPTEAEWEYACRAFTETPFSAGETVTPEQVNYNGNYPYRDDPKGLYRAKTLPVEALPANGFGLHNLHGNVAEWCADLHQGADAGTPGVGTAPNPRQLRTCRGGAWSSFSWACRSAAREGALPDKPHHLRGLRPALTPR